MRILDLYIGRVITSATFITLSVFVSISGIIRFVDEVKKVGNGDYDVAHAALFVFYAVARDVELFFPMAALIGGLIGIGMMASNSEIVVMQASGLSRLDIIKSVMKTASFLIVISMAIGEWGAPAAEEAAIKIRAQAMSGGSLISSKSGIWAKDGKYFVHIGEVQDRGTLKEIQIYRFDDDLKLSSWTEAESAKYVGKTWLLKTVTETVVNKDHIESTSFENKEWTSLLTPDKLGVVTVDPEALSIRGLTNYLDYLEANGQDQSRYQLAFWRKVVQPMTVAVMLLVALSFIFGPLRSVSMGARILMGIFTGLLFHVSNQVMGSIALVYQLPPVTGATIPSVLFIIVALYFMKKKAV